MIEVIDRARAGPSADNRLLRLRSLQAGDVLLTQGLDLQAAAVAAFSGGDFSHAGVWLPIATGDPSSMARSWPGLQLVESDQLGVGPSLPTTLSIRENGRSREQVALLRHVRSASLVRHPELSAVSPEILAQAAASLAETHFYRSYSRRARLVRASNLPLAAQVVVGQVIAIADPNDPLPGAFCSELVAQFFKLLGLPLFDDDPLPATLSPSRLGSLECALKPVAEAVLHPGHLPSSTEVDWSAAYASEGRALIPHVVKTKGETAQILDGLAIFATEVNNQRRTHLEQAARTHALLLRQLEEDRWRPPLRKAANLALERQWARAIFADCLDGLLKYYEGKNFSELGTERYQGLLALRIECERLWLQISHDHLRSTVLSGLVISHSQRNWRRRKSLIRSWRGRVRSHGQAAAALASGPTLDPAIVGSTSSLAFMRSVLLTARSEAKERLVYRLEENPGTPGADGEPAPS